MSSNSAQNNISQERVLKAFKEMQSRLNAYEYASSEPIAITGIGCRFPGNAHNLSEFWQLLLEERDVISPVPQDRWDIEAYYDADPTAPGKMYTNLGAFLSEPIDRFDAQFFGISPREAADLDPQQRLLMEVTWEALENAGVPARGLVGSQTGVFVGSFNNDYFRLQVSEQVPLDVYTLLGSAPATMAGRLAYSFGLQGPTLQIDTACSSSLVALHLACQSLRQKECQLAIVGSASLILTPDTSIYLSRLHALAPDGRCKTFDASADGYVRGEGCGVFVLKRLSDALAVGDPILALVRGSAVNHDGASNGITAPNGLAQRELLRTALRNARLEPSQVQYVEAHGTGTSLGDPIEVNALADVLGPGHSADNPLLIGSVKTNIGHLEPTAGMAGLCKVVLAMQHAVIPAHLHLRTPNPYIAWSELPLKITTQQTAWSIREVPRIAGISSFGLTGTNAHVLLEEPPRQPEPLHESGKPPFLLPLSAANQTALDELVSRYQQFLSTDTQADLFDICYTASVRRSHLAQRLSVVARSSEEMCEKLHTYCKQEPAAGLYSGRKEGREQPRVVFVFPGQGSQWIGMGRQLFEKEPVFREAIELCGQAMRPFVSWSLVAMLLGHVDQQAWERIDVIQPLIFAIQVALAAFWRSQGVQPDAVVGHSMGEIAAFVVAGALSLDDAARIICLRSQLLCRVRGQGAMALIELSHAVIEQELVGYESKLSVAVCNSSRSTVLSGDPVALDELLARFSQRDIFCRRINVDVASHSPQMDSLRADLLQALKPVQPRATTIPLYSTVTGKPVGWQELDALYWVRNLRQPVLFVNALHGLFEQGYTLYIELSPHPTLVPAIEDELRLRRQVANVLPSLRRHEDEQNTLLEGLAALYSYGYDLDWSKLYPTQGRCVQLPNYPWQREHFWLARGRANSAQRSQGHPLLGSHLESSLQAGTHYWEQSLNLDALPYLIDHQVQGVVIFPGAAYIEMLFAAAEQLYGPDTYTLQDLSFSRTLTLLEGQTRRIQLVLSRRSDQLVAFQILSRPEFAEQKPSKNTSLEKAPEPEWSKHAEGTIRIGSIHVSSALLQVNEIQARCADTIDREIFYQRALANGLHYGPAFQGIEQIWRGSTEALSRLRLSAAVFSDRQYSVHPALLDACFQTTLALFLGPEAEGSPFLPIAAEYIVHSERAFALLSTEKQFWAYVQTQKQEQKINEHTMPLADVSLFDEQGQLLLEVRAIRLKQLQTPNATNPLPSWLYHIDWLPQAKIAETGSRRATAETGIWLLLADTGKVTDSLRTYLEQNGEQCVIVTRGPGYARFSTHSYQVNPLHAETLQQLFLSIQRAHDGMVISGVVCLWSLDEWVRDGEINLPEQEELCNSVLHLVQALLKQDWRDLPRLWLVTRSAQAVSHAPGALSPTQAALWGFGRSIAYEQPKLRCTLIDLSELEGDDELRALNRELWVSEEEDQIALRGDQRYTARLQHYQLVSHKAPETIDSTPEIPLHEAGEQAFHVEIVQPGILEHLVLRAITRRPPGPGEVEIEVCAAGLNFIDVLKAMGVYPGQDIQQSPVLGGECAGRISALGEGVDDLQIGDEVMALAPGSLASFVTTSASFVLLKPAELSFEEAATIPLVFVTTYYALIHQGQLAAGERILIHSATGGTGLAAIQLAQQVGAEIFATVGNEEKRTYLQKMGIHHIMDSRSLSFVGQIRAQTADEGIDVVLNSLTGEAIPASFSVLRPYGRFLEIGKKDIYADDGQLSLHYFRKNLSYVTIDVAAMLDQRPLLLRSLFQQVLEALREKRIQPLPMHVYPVVRVQEAFHTMAQGKHIGKLIISFAEREKAPVLPAYESTRHVMSAAQTVQPDASYLLTGGLGGLGQRVAEWLVEQGARFLVLVGRHSPSSQAERMLEGLRQRGVTIEVALADVAQQQEMAAVLTRVKQSLPPLRGVFHLAAVLEDGIIPNLKSTSFTHVFAPKVAGALNLHQLTLHEQLDFFVLFSSVVSLFGASAQSNYAAANAFLDTFAHYRRSLGLPALSINWGNWAEVGLAAAQGNRGERLVTQGFASMTPEQGVTALDCLLQEQLQSGVVQVAVMPFNLRQWRQSNPYAARSRLFAALIGEQAQVAQTLSDESVMRQRLQEAVPTQRRILLEAHLCEQMSRVLRLPLARVDAQTVLQSLGFDSLMAVELRNRLENSLHVNLPSTLVWKYPTVAALADHLMQQIHLSLTAEEAVQMEQENMDGSKIGAIPSVEQLPTEDVKALLLAELDSLPAEFLD